MQIVQIVKYFYINWQITISFFTLVPFLYPSSLPVTWLSFSNKWLTFYHCKMTLLAYPDNLAHLHRGHTDKAKVWLNSGPGATPCDPPGSTDGYAVLLEVLTRLFLLYLPIAQEVL